MGLIDKLIKKKIDDTVKIYVPKLILCVIVGSVLLILAIYFFFKNLNSLGGFMRKFFILSAFVLATVALPLQFGWGQVEPPDEPPYAVVTMVAGGVTSGFGEWSGGFLFGGEYPVAKDGDVSFRFVYSQFNWNPEAPIRILQPATLLKFDIGKGWDVWFVTGGDLYLAGQNAGAAFFGGFGGSRTVLTYQNEKGNFGYFDLAGEMTMTGAGDKSTGSYWQVKVGVAFRPAI